MPRHINPNKTDRTATAPYNFVPLPLKVITVETGIPVNGTFIKPWERHDEDVLGTFSGWVDLDIATLTPLYIRGPTRQNGEWDARESRLRPDPYTMVDGCAVIPGSSLRGAVRSLVEILAFGKIAPVSHVKPFFRDISPSRISAEYRKHFVEDLGSITSGIDVETSKPVKKNAPGYGLRVRAGFINAADRTIVECGTARVEQQMIRQELGHQLCRGSGPMATPNPKLQRSKVYVKADSHAENYFFSRKTTSGGKMRHPDLYLRFRKVHEVARSRRAGLLTATLVITGGIQNKHLEFVFLDEERAQAVSIPGSIWNRFHDDDQITLWQERAFPRAVPTGGGRKRAGHLDDHEPVFFLADDSKKSEANPHGLVFLGRAQMFRLPYDLNPEALVPEDLCGAPLDVAEAMFGRVGRVKGMDRESLKGRVFFENAITASASGSCTEDVLVPRTLSSPKPTTFQHYLTQDGTKGVHELTTYLNGDHTTIRGHKLYWHRWEIEKGIQQIEEMAKHANLLNDLQKDKPEDTQHTIIQPIKSGIHFTGRVRFDNLTDVELGALLFALQLPEGCAHKLGMGKSLGLGSVRIEASLRLIHSARRRENWNNDGVLHDDGLRFRDAFEKMVLAHAVTSAEALAASESGLRGIGRLDALFTMLEWRKRPAVSRTTSMELHQFRTRPVLPTPHRVAGLAEPNWNVDPPRPRGPSQQKATHTAASPAPPRAVERVIPRALQPSKPIEKGQTRAGSIHQLGNGWVARFEGDDRDAVITNAHKLPQDASEGLRGEFYILEQSKKGGIRARFERVQT